ncbi:MAG: DUF3810 family protein [Acidobacteria bacterium]|nr:DUF3810 family protein [Acidobacteriota bacterium]
MTRVSNLVPFALLDALLIGVAVLWIWSAVRDLRRSTRTAGRWMRLAGRLTGRTLGIVAALYIAFLLTWGLNYQRASLSDRLVRDPQGATPEGAEQLVARAVAELNALYPGAHAPGLGGASAPGGSLAAAFGRAQASLGIRHPARPARPKWTILDPYFKSAGVSGMTDPYFLEILVAADLLPVERPFVIAHEWSHLAGFANEGEANFLGWLTCVRGAPADQYSGWLFLYSEALPGLARPVRDQLAGRLAAGPGADLRAIADRLRRNVRPRVANAGWQVYDRYLRANRVEGGTASYREVVRLVLTTRFDATWAPSLK